MTKWTFRLNCTIGKCDIQSSYALAETFSPSTLLFDPAVLDFDRVTFNTEAHPLKRIWK